MALRNETGVRVDFLNISVSYCALSCVHLPWLLPPECSCCTWLTLPGKGPFSIHPARSG